MAQYPTEVQRLPHGVIHWERPLVQLPKKDGGTATHVEVECGDCGKTWLVMPSECRRPGRERTGRCNDCNVQEMKKHLKTDPGERHSRYRGRERVNWHGYREVAVYPGDPWYEEMGKHSANDHRSVRYITEHRWVMANKLGRALHPLEHVHHIDGNKQNNAETNLELLSGRMHGIVTSLEIENKRLLAEVHRLRQEINALQGQAAA